MKMHIETKGTKEEYKDRSSIKASILNGQHHKRKYKNKQTFIQNGNRN